MSRQAKKLLTSEAKKFLAEDRVLVYHYRANGAPLVKNGLAVIPRRELEEILRTHPRLLETHKTLEPRAKGVDIHQGHLIALGGSAGTHGNEASNVANIQLPLIIWLEGLLRGKGKGWREVIVLSERMGA